MSAADRGVCPHCGEIFCTAECLESRRVKLAPTPDSGEDFMDGKEPGCQWLGGQKYTLEEAMPLVVQMIIDHPDLYLFENIRDGRVNLSVKEVLAILQGKKV